MVDSVRGSAPNSATIQEPDEGFPQSIAQGLSSDIICWTHWWTSQLWDKYLQTKQTITWWRHRMETFSALLALWAGNSPVTGKFPSQRPVTRSFDGFFDLRLNKRLSKQSRRWWFETSSCPLWRHCNEWVMTLTACLLSGASYQQRLAKPAELGHGSVITSIKNSRMP